MTDSPAVQAPLDPREQPILDAVLTIRDNLSLLKQDKSTYIKSQDILDLYDQTIEQVHQLNRIRKDHGKPLEQNRGTSKPYKQRSAKDFRTDKMGCWLTTLCTD